MSTAPPALDMKSILADTVQPRRGVLRRRRCRQDHHRGGDGGARGGVRPHRGVLTIDPAKRLAQALGIRELGNEPQRVPLAPEVSGELHAMMLDMRRTFDEMVVEYSGPERAQAILDNQFYQTVATSLAGTQEYMAMEKLGQLLGQDRWDLVVVDTPPSRNALDFLDAPEAAGQLHGQPAVASAAGARARDRPHRHRCRRPGDEGDVDDPGFADALRRLGLRAVAGFDVRRLPGEGRPHLRTAQAARHPVRGGLGGRTGRAAGGVVLRRPALAGGHAAGRA